MDEAGPQLGRRMPYLLAHKLLLAWIAYCLSGLVACWETASICGLITLRCLLVGHFTALCPNDHAVAGREKSGLQLCLTVELRHHQDNILQISAIRNQCYHASCAYMTKINSADRGSGRHRIAVTGKIFTYRTCLLLLLSDKMPEFFLLEVDPGPPVLATSSPFGYLLSEIQP